MTEKPEKPKTIPPVDLAQTKKAEKHILLPEEQKYLVANSVIKHFDLEPEDFDIDDRTELAKYYSK